MSLFAYIDESGDTGYSKKSSRYFILTVVKVESEYYLRRIAKDIHAYKINKRKTSILHANKETMIIRRKCVKKLVQSDVECFVFVVDKHIIKLTDVYMYTLSKIANYFRDKDIIFIIAQKDTRKSYNKTIISLFNLHGLKAKFSNPNNEKSLQIADFYSWCIYSHMEYTNSTYFFELQNQITFL